MVEKLIHKGRAKTFFTILKEERDDPVTNSFDCQKNMVLPKVPDQAAYYIRQFYIYNFEAVVGSSRASLSKENVFFITWTENEFAKESNQIASAVFNHLCCLNVSHAKTVRLVCDGCGGQNKNSAMICMTTYWLFKKAPRNVEILEIIFPVPDHSYIPPDRAFALVEKHVQQKQTIITPKEYHEIHQNCATVIHLGDENCPVFDWKTSTMEYICPTGTWHFKFNESKRFILTRDKSGAILVRGEPYYLSDIRAPKSVIKKHKQISRMEPLNIEVGVQLKEEKLRDVFNLLSKHYGEDWRSIEKLKFYKNIEEFNGLGHILGTEDPICETQPLFNGTRV